MLEIDLVQVRGLVPVTVMRLKGELSFDGAHLFDTRTDEIIASGSKQVLIDLSKVSYMSSVGVRAIHRLFYHLHPEGTEEYKRILEDGVRQGKYKAQHLKLLNPSERVSEVLKLVGIDTYLEIISGDEMKAINSFSQ